MTILPGLLVLVALLANGAVSGLYAGIERDLPTALDQLCRVFLVASLWSWFWPYSRAHRLALPLDMGMFLVVAWIVILPYYIFKAEGRRAWGLIAIFGMGVLAASGVAVAVNIWVRVLLHE